MINFKKVNHLSPITERVIRENEAYHTSKIRIQEAIITLNMFPTTKE